MKRVTFEVAKAIREAGYPQDYDTAFYSEDGSIHINTTSEYRLYMKENKLGYDAPSALDVWLWLWREKKISIPVNEWEADSDGKVISFYSRVKDGIFEKTDPEEVIISAINHLVKNNLIK